MLTPSWLKILTFLTLALSPAFGNAQVDQEKQRLLKRVNKEIGHQPLLERVAADRDFEGLGNSERFKVNLPVMDQRTGHTRTSEVLIYLPHLGLDYLENLPVVLVASTVRGVTLYERLLANRLNAAGYAAVLVDSRSLTSETSEDSLKEVYDNSLHAIRIIRTTLDWLDQKPNLPYPSRIKTGSYFVLGISNGASLALIATAVDQRIIGVSVVSAFSDLPYSMTHSNHPKIEELRRIISKELNLNPKQFQEHVEQSIPMDVLDLAPLLLEKSEVLYQIVSTDDKVSPVHAQLNLVEAIGNHQVSTIDSGHAVTLLKTLTPKHLNRILAHFKSRKNSGKNTCDLTL